MKYLFILLFLLSCGEDKSDTVSVNDFYDSCKNFSDNSKFDAFEVYVDYYKDIGLTKRCTLEKCKDHKCDYVHMDEKQIEAINLYKNTRTK